MKRTFLWIMTLMGVISVSAQTDEVLMTIDNKPVMASEFMYIYQKNNQETAIEQKTIDEYLDLFINFKLKVTEAEARGIDTTAAFLKELRGYRAQATPKYMRDDAATEAAIRRVYKWTGSDRRVAHIAVECPMSADTATEAAARKKIQVARERVTTGLKTKKGKKWIQQKPETFADVVAEVSTDPSAVDNQGELGWISPFRFVYSFEKAVYETPVGQVTEVFRSPYGFHIALVEEERPHEEIHASHIMQVTPKGDNEKAARAKIVIDSIATLLKNGEDFGTIAQTLSEDKGSAIRGGDLSWFGRGMMVKPFEDAVYALKDSGDITPPFKTQFGWHIAMLQGRRGQRPYEEMKEELSKKIMRDERKQELDNAFVERLKKEYNYSENAGVREPYYTLIDKYNNVNDSSFKAEVKHLNGKGIMMTFADKRYVQADFTDYLLRNALSNLNGRKVIDEKYNLWVSRLIREYEDSQLENKYPELRKLVTEYHDGILLFDVSMDEVWDRAAKDTAGITKFFNENKANYTWDAPRYKGIVLYCKDKNTLKAAKSIVKKAQKDSVESYLRRLNSDSIQYVKFEKGLWLQGKNGAIDKMGFKTKKADYSPSEKFPYVYVEGKVLKAPEVYTDERGKVTSDYQEYLDKKWVEQLRKKYTVKVNEEVFNKLKK